MTDIPLPQPPSVLNMGAPGSGKTWALSTFLKSGINLFSIVTEPHGVESLIDAVRTQGLDMNLLHWHYVPPSSPGWTALRKAATLANTMSYKDLSDLKMGVAREEQKALFRLFDLCEHLMDQRTGKDLGPVERLGPTWAVALDSLSGLNDICKQNTVGFKPSPHQGEWGTCMSLEEQILNQLSSDLTSFFVVNCHIDRVVEEVSLSSKVVPAALGSKLGPRIPKYFGDFVYSQRREAGFTWSTLSNEADLKNRTLPIRKELPPDYTPIVEGFRARIRALQEGRNDNAA